MDKNLLFDKPPNLCRESTKSKIQNPDVMTGINGHVEDDINESVRLLVKVLD
jgi:hypothetical protein